MEQVVSSTPQACGLVCHYPRQRRASGVGGERRGPAETPRAAATSSVLSAQGCEECFHPRTRASRVPGESAEMVAMESAAEVPNDSGQPLDFCAGA
jgi:hypothetical protein